MRQNIDFTSEELNLIYDQLLVLYENSVGAYSNDNSDISKMCIEDLRKVLPILDKFQKHYEPASDRWGEVQPNFTNKQYIEFSILSSPFEEIRSVLDN